MGKQRPDEQAYSNQTYLPWISVLPYDYRDKQKTVSDLIHYMMLRTAEMFEWKGLPDSLPYTMLESMLQGIGYALVFKNGEDIICGAGNLGGQRNVYYEPKDFIISNPWLNGSEKSRTYDTTKDDCVLVKNDYLMKGLRDLNSRYATLMAENEVSMNLVSIISRAQAIIVAGNDSDRLAAEDFIKQLIKGEYKSVVSKDFIQKITSQPLTGGSSANILSQLIEFEQYIKASWNNELGLDSNYNMKRESLSMTESQMNSDALLPLVDQMLKCRKKACDEINAKFGTSISVDFASSWKDNHEQIESANEMMEEPEQTEEPEVAEDEQSN